MAIPSKINEIRAKILGEAFGSGLSSDQKLSIAFEHVATSGGREQWVTKADRYGAQQARGKYLAESEVSKVNVLNYAYQSGEVQDIDLWQMSGTSFAGDSESLAKKFLRNEVGGQKINFAWDAYTTRHMLARNSAGFGGQEAAFVSVGKMAKEAFSDIYDFGSPVGKGIKGFGPAVIKKLGSEEIKPGSSLSYLHQTFGAYGKDLSDLTEAEQLEGVFHASMLKASAEGKMPRMKQLLYKGGVQGLEGMDVPIGNIRDPMGMGSIIENAIKPGSKGAMFTGVAGEDLEGFLGKVSYFTGDKYAQEILKPRIKTLYRASDDLSGALRFVLSKSGSLYVGKGDQLDSYQPLVTEALERTRAGWFPGIGKMGEGKDSFFGIKKGLKGSKYVPGSERMLDEFIEAATQQYAGLQKKNLPIALQAGFRRARKIGANLKVTGKSRGIFDIGGVSSVQYQAFDPEASNKFHEGIREISGKIGKMQDNSEVWDAIMNPQRVMKQGQSEHFYMVSPKEGSVALKGVEKFFIPGTVSAKEIEKSLHHRTRFASISSEEMERMSAVRSAKAPWFRPELKVQASPVGITEGEYQSLRDIVRFSRKNQLGSVGGTSFTMPVMFMPKPADLTEMIKQRQTYGDPTYQLTGMGREMFGKMKLSTFAPSVPLNKGDMQGFLDVLEKETGSPIKDFILNELGEQRSVTQERFELTKPVKNALQKLGVRMPAGAHAITHMEYSPYDDMVKFGFESYRKPSAIAGIIGGNRAMWTSPITAGDTVVDKFFGAVTSNESLSNLNKQNLLFTDLTELSKFTPGGVKVFHSRFQETAERKGLNKNIIRYHRKAQGEFLTPDHSLKASQFDNRFYEALEETLQGLGVSKKVISGDARERARFFGLSEDEVAQIPEGAIHRFVHAAHRFRGTEDITSQKNAMRIRLEYLKDFAGGHKEMFGVDPEDNPIFMRMQSHFESHTGIKVSRELLKSGHSLPGIQAELQSQNSMPWKHFKAIAAQYQGPEYVEKFAAEYKIPVISEQEALDLFIRGPHGAKFDSELSRGGVSRSSLENTALFSNDLRPQQYRGGVFIKRARPSDVPLTNSTMETVAGVSNTHIFIPGTDPSLRPYFGLPRAARGLNVRLPSDSIEHNLLGYLTTAAYPELEDKSVFNSQQFLDDLFRGFADYTKNTGKLKEALLVGPKMKGGASLRLLPKTYLSDTQRNLLAAATEPTEEMFTVGVSPSTVRRIFGKKGSEPVLEEMRNKGFVWGSVHPNPMHSTAHVGLVKYKLTEELGQMVNAEVEPYGQLDAFITWKMNRDNDKDVVNALMVPNVTKGEQEQLEQIFANQLKNNLSEYNQFKAELSAAREEGLNVSEFLIKHKEDLVKKKNVNILEHYGAYLRFGSTPSIAYAGHWTPSALIGGLVSESNEEEIAKSFNMAAGASKLKKPFTPGDIKRYRKLLAHPDLDAGSVAGISDMLEANIKQAFITKGGKYQQAAVEYLNTPHKIAALRDLGKITDEEAVAMSQKAAYKLFSEMDEKFRPQGQYFSELERLGVSRGEIIKKAAEIHGSRQAVSALMYADTVTPKARRAAMYNTLRMATSKRNETGQAEGLTKLFAPEAPGLNIRSVRVIPRKAKFAGSQESIAQANLEITAKAAKEAATESTKVADKASGWLRRNWKMAGAVIGGLIGIRMAEKLLSKDDMDRPPLKTSQRLQFANAPIPREPIVSSQPPEMTMSPVRPRAFVQPPNGSYTRTQYNASYSNVSMNTMPFTTDTYGSIDINDNRSYTTNWQMQNLADAAGNSDFLNPFEQMI